MEVSSRRRSSGDEQDRDGDDGEGEEEGVGQEAGASGVHVVPRFCRVVTFLSFDFESTQDASPMFGGEVRSVTRASTEG